MARKSHCMTFDFRSSIVTLLTLKILLYCNSYIHPSFVSYVSDYNIIHITGDSTTIIVYTYFSFFG